MPLVIEPATEADLSDYVDIQHAAFADGEVGLLLNSRGPLTEARRKMYHERSLNDMKNPTYHYIKCVDTDLNKTIGFGKWRIHPNGRTQQEVDDSWYTPTPQPESNVKAEHDFFMYLNESRRDYMGTKPVVFLHVMVTLPEHQGRGAGRMMMKWGVDEADRLGLDAYVESSEAGRRLYESFGFKMLKERIWKLADYGIPGDLTATNAILWRDAPSKKVV
ncbi:acyl-CoA N-acyltransferase [Pseudovirgaria hyperparasitica]|uniref:Acyl-CoA N-acyltransferase n=1 Tax=Pseudovirgaria hyperparasitica TaxID=470096 RepID=A0A6A6WBC1_9PEZI|nr:acyl-CoA N-acyltransferase [Pseudovirgaria hyperparasitica]KAF2759344.1 acyl-CoA N-acyltransferase [Pseudovirgaria hyperparasitica]